MVPGMHSHLEVQWQLPGYRRFVRGLTRHCRLTRYDKLGTSLSDPTISTPTVGERVDDLAAVAAACGATAPVLLGFSEGGPLAIRFAAAHRVSGLVLYGTSVRPPTSEARAELDLVLRDWGSGRSLDTFAPSLAADPAARRITASLERAAASPAMIRHVIGALADSSAEGLLEHLRIPTLVLHRAHEFIPVTEARNLAEHIPGAQLEILPGIDHQPWAGDVDAIIRPAALGRRYRPPNARSTQPHHWRRNHQDNGVGGNLRETETSPPHTLLRHRDHRSTVALTVCQRPPHPAAGYPKSLRSATANVVNLGFHRVSGW